MKDDKAFPAILAFKYAEFLRARGELMLKFPSTKRLPWAEIMRLTDEQFLAHFGASKEEFTALQKEVEQTPEIDITNRTLFRQIGRLEGMNDTKQ